MDSDLLYHVLPIALQLKHLLDFLDSCWDEKNARMTTVSVVSACTKDSMIGSKKINGSCDSLKFLRLPLRLRRVFLKSLDIPQHSVILMDNVKFHHSIIIKKYCKLHLIDILYVPAYSPWFAARKRALREQKLSPIIMQML